MPSPMQILQDHCARLESQLKDAEEQIETLLFAEGDAQIQEMRAQNAENNLDLLVFAIKQHKCDNNDDLLMEALKTIGEV